MTHTTSSPIHWNTITHIHTLLLHIEISSHTYTLSSYTLNYHHTNTLSSYTLKYHHTHTHSPPTRWCSYMHLFTPIRSLSWVGRKNNFRWKQLRILGLHHWKARTKVVKKYSLSKLQNRRESAIPKLNTRVYGNRKKQKTNKKNHSFPALHAPAFCYAVRCNRSSVKFAAICAHAHH